MKRLAFLSAFVTPEALGSTDECILVFLDPGLSLMRCYDSYEHANPIEWFTAADYSCMYNEVQTLFARFAENFEGHCEYFSYEFYLGVSPLIYLREVVRRALAYYAPDMVLIASSCLLTTVIDNTVVAIKQALYNTVLGKETEGYPRQFLSFSQIPHRKEIVRRISSMLIFLPYDLVDRVAGKILRKRTLPIAFIGQKVKIRLLELLLSNRFGSSMENINDRVSACRSHCRLPLVTEDLVTESFLHMFLAYANQMNKDLKKLDELGGGDWEMLFSTDYASPEARRLVDVFALAGKPVVFLPEGLGQPNAAMSKYVSNFFYRHPNVIWFALSKHFQEYLLNDGRINSTVLTGFLGINTRLNRLTAITYKSWARVSSKWAGKVIILYTLAPVTREGWIRFSCEETPQEVLHHLDCFLDQIDPRLYKVVVKLHPATTCRKDFVKRYTHRGVQVVQFLPIELMLQVAHCTVVFHSSAGLESLLHHCPVLVWNPTGRPNYSDSYLDEQSSVVMKVEDSEDIPAALERLLHHDPVDFARYEQYIARKPENAVRWIEGKMASAAII